MGGMDGYQGTWKTVGRAAAAAGVARRSAFRWAASGTVQTRKEGRRRLVEVSDLRTLAMNSFANSAMALDGTVEAFPGPEYGHKPLQGPSLASALVRVEEQLAALWARLERLERALRIP